MRVDEAKDWDWVKILGCQNMILATNQGCEGKIISFGVIFGHFGALMGASEVKDVQHCLPWCVRDWMEHHIGPG